MATPIDRLLAELDNARDKWPLPREAAALSVIYRRRAWRVQASEELRLASNWDQRWSMRRRDYVVDPLARTIAGAWGAFLFGQPPTILAADEADAELYQAIEQANGFQSTLPRAERICSSEGEVWWHAYVDREVSPDAALVDWVSRSRVIPLYRGAHLLACAFVSKVRADSDSEVYRLVEMHEPGQVWNFLYLGTQRRLGGRVDLSTIGETDGLIDTWTHGLPMLAGRIVNDLDDDPKLGVSDLDAVESLLFALNEARTIAVENARLTAKQRVYTTGKLVRPDGFADIAGLDAFIVETESGEMGADTQPPIKALDVSYDALPLIAHTRELVETILSRCSIVPNMITGDVDGHAQSGTAIRLRFMPTVNAADEKGGEWDAHLPSILALLAALSAKPVDEGGLGAALTSMDEPSVARADPLPIDEVETVTTNATAVAASIRSRETAIRAQHGEWTEEQVAAELRRIDEDQSGGAPPLTLDGADAVATDGSGIIPPDPAGVAPAAADSSTATVPSTASGPRLPAGAQK